MRPARLLPLFAVLLLVSCFSAQADEPLPNRADVGSVPSTDIDLDVEALPPKGSPKLESSLWRLVEAQRRGGPAELSAEAQRSAIALRDGEVRVVVEAKDGRFSSAIASARSLGATLEASHGDLVQVLVPVAALERLSSDPSVRFVRQPTRYFPAVTGEGVGLVNADDWHAAGITGGGVKVAVLDAGFSGYSSLLGSELPSSVTTQSFRADGDISGGGEVHGTAVAEIVHEVAPDAEMYLVNFETDVELGNAVSWIVSQEVDVINFSMGCSVCGPGDGTGFENDLVSWAASNGTLWSSAAGNEADAHWAGDWYDPDDDDIHNFAPDDESDAISVSARQQVWVGLKWDDPWASSCNDYDLYVFDRRLKRVAYSWNVQDCFSAPPVEALVFTASSTGVYHIVIARYSATRAPSFHLYVYPGWPMQYTVAAGSLSIPADNPDALSVGAVPWSSPDTIESFSSQGPTEDNRKKPDIVAPDYVSSATYGPSGFGGTSAAAPHAAGAAALVKETYPSYSSAQIKTFLEGRAVDLGAAGKDNVYGSGRLDLGELPLEFSLDRLAEDTWRYFGWASTRHLPWSWKSTEVAGGDYANPAEIGLYMLAYLGAHALGNSWSPSSTATRTEIKATLDQLEAWQTGSQPEQPHGANAYDDSVFFQWYWIWDPPVVGADGSPESDNQYVPSVDNAWLALSLLVISEYAQAEGWSEVAEVADSILSRMDFGIWYDPATHLFSHGGKWNDVANQWEQYDEEKETWVEAPDWDYYSNEGRIINFVARALAQLSDQEFADSLSVLDQDPGTYDRGTPDPSDDVTVGKENWDGSYFTYLAPALFTHERNTPYGEDTLDRATEAQIAYAEDKGYTLWGISDCFPPNGEDVEYADRGAPPCANCDPDPPDDGLITPHASALALNTSYGSDAFTNLQGLSGCGGVYSDDYGFKDSVYWDCSDVADRFSTIAQAWIFLSLVNHEKGTIWKYLYRDLGIITAHEEMYPIEDDSDNDDFIDSLEFYIGTDPLDDCRDDPDDDAWPLDMNNDGIAKINDVLYFQGRLRANVGEPMYWARLDLNADGIIKINDVLKYQGHLRETCT